MVKASSEDGSRSPSLIACPSLLIAHTHSPSSTNQRIHRVVAVTTVAAMSAIQRDQDVTGCEAEGSTVGVEEMREESRPSLVNIVADSTTTKTPIATPPRRKAFSPRKRPAFVDEESDGSLATISSETGEVEGESDGMNVGMKSEAINGPRANSIAIAPPVSSGADLFSSSLVMLDKYNQQLNSIFASQQPPQSANNDRNLEMMAMYPSEQMFLGATPTLFDPSTFHAAQQFSAQLAAAGVLDPRNGFVLPMTSSSSSVDESAVFEAMLSNVLQQAQAAAQAKANTSGVHAALRGNRVSKPRNTVKTATSGVGMTSVIRDREDSIVAALGGRLRQKKPVQAMLIAETTTTTSPASSPSPNICVVADRRGSNAGTMTIAALRRGVEDVRRGDSVEVTDLDELEDFAQTFKKQRIKLGFTQGDVGAALGRRYGTDFSQTTISRFEALNLSFKNMCKLKPMLAEWLAEAERAVEAGVTVADLINCNPRLANATARSNASQVQATRDVQRNETAISSPSTSPASTGYSESAPASSSSFQTVSSSSHNGVLHASATMKKRRKRTNLDEKQRVTLAGLFLANCRPDNERITHIANQLALDREVVRVWFCNRRQKMRKEE